MKNIVLMSALLLAASFSQAQTAGTSTTSVTSPSLPWTVSAKSEWSSNIETAKQVGGAATENQFRIAYKLTDKVQLGLLFGGKYNLANENQIQSDQEFIGMDTALAGLFVAPSFLGSDKTEVDARVYLPTTEASQKAKQLYQLRADIKLPYTFSSARSATLQVSPRVSDFEVAATKLELVSQAKFAQGSKVAPYIALNHKLKMLNTAGMSRTEEYVGPELGVELVPHKMVKLAFLVAQERNILNPSVKKVRPEYSAFDTKETKYLMSAQIKL